jgi:hypothetical protein
MQLFVDRFRAKNTKAAQAQSKLKQIERLKEDMVETPDGGFQLSPAAAAPPWQRALKIRQPSRQPRAAGVRHGDKTSWTVRGQDIADSLEFGGYGSRRRKKRRGVSGFSPFVNA